MRPGGWSLGRRLASHRWRAWPAGPWRRRPPWSAHGVLHGFRGAGPPGDGDGATRVITILTPGRAAAQAGPGPRRTPHRPGPHRRRVSFTTAASRSSTGWTSPWERGVRRRCRARTFGQVHAATDRARLLRPASVRCGCSGRPHSACRSRGASVRTPTIRAGGDVPVTVEEVVATGRLSRRGWWRRPGPSDRAAVDHALRAVALTDLRRRPVEELSGGQQQRVLIARALAGDPELLVLDEPVAGVDAESQRLFRDSLVHLVREHGAAVLLVSHELGAVADDLDRVVVLRHRVVFDGPPADLARRGVSLVVHAEDLPLWLEGLVSRPRRGAALMACRSRGRSTTTTCSAPAASLVVGACGPLIARSSCRSGSPSWASVWGTSRSPDAAVSAGRVAGLDGPVARSGALAFTSGSAAAAGRPATWRWPVFYAAWRPVRCCRAGRRERRQTSFLDVRLVSRGSRRDSGRSCPGRLIVASCARGRGRAGRVLERRPPSVAGCPSTP